jgi:hypothetical protein
MSARLFCRSLRTAFNTSSTGIDALIRVGCCALTPAVTTAHVEARMAQSAAKTSDFHRHYPWWCRSP